MSDPAIDAAIARGKATANRITEVRAALFLPFRALLTEFGPVAAEACIAGVWQAVRGGEQIGDGALLEMPAGHEKHPINPEARDAAPE